MVRAAAISAERLSARVGRRMRVLVDAVDKNTAIARSEADAPEIDGVVRISKAGKAARRTGRKLRSPVRMPTTFRRGS